MKILRVIVDELPRSASRCDAHRANWNQLYQKLDVGCGILKDYWLMTERDFTTERCPDCPLALADALMDSHGAAFSELAKGAE